MIASSAVLGLKFIPESVRFLTTKSRFDQADAIFHKIASSNNRTFTHTTARINLHTTSTPKPLTLTAYFSTRTTQARMAVSLLNWFANSFVYYGIGLNTDVLGGNPYLNYFYSTLVELFGVLASHYILTRHGRRNPYLANFTITACSLIAIGFVPPGLNWLTIVLVLAAKFSISFNYNTIYIITSESYPTVIRSTAVATCAIAGRVASTMSPYVVLLGSVYGKSLPYVIYGSVAGTAGLLYFAVMPETCDRKLPETFEDALDHNREKTTAVEDEN